MPPLSHPVNMELERREEMIQFILIMLLVVFIFLFVIATDLYRKQEPKIRYKTEYMYSSAFQLQDGSSHCHAIPAVRLQEYVGGKWIDVDNVPKS